MTEAKSFVNLLYIWAAVTFFICPIKVAYCNISKVCTKLSNFKELELHEHIYISPVDIAWRLSQLFPGVFRWGIDLRFVLPPGSANGHRVPWRLTVCWSGTMTTPGWLFSLPFDHSCLLIGKPLIHCHERSDNEFSLSPLYNVVFAAFNGAFTNDWEIWKGLLSFKISSSSTLSGCFH